MAENILANSCRPAVCSYQCQITKLYSIISKQDEAITYELWPVH